MSSDEIPWYEDEEFWKMYPLFTDKKLKEAGEEVEKIISLADLDSDIKVLDLCCGIGRHSIVFADRGYDVTAVDITEHYLERAREKGEEKSVEIEFIKEDMRKFKREGEFDIVLNLFTSFGYFEDNDENLQVLKNVYKSLKPNGKFILDVLGKEVIARIFKGKEWKEINGDIWLFERNIKKDWSRFEDNMMKVVNGDVKEFNTSHWLYSAKELKDMLEGVGFTSLDVYGNYDGKPYDEEADRLVVLAEK